MSSHPSPSPPLTQTTTVVTHDSKGGHGGFGMSKSSARIIGSACAGLLELLIFHPIDTIAKRLMTTKQKYNIRPVQTATVGSTATAATATATAASIPTGIGLGAVPSAASHTTLTDILFPNAGPGAFNKWKSLFPGLGFAAGYKISQRIYKFGGQPVMTDLLSTHYGQWFRARGSHGTELLHATAGALIGVGEVILLPLDNLKIKAQTNPTALTAGSFLKLSTLRALYAGVGLTALRNAMGSFMLFGGAAVVYDSVFHLQDYKKATLMQFFLASVAGSTTSIIISAPLDVIKTRVQQANFDHKISGITVVQQLIKHEGFSALFKGLVPKLSIVGPKLIFSFTAAQYIIAKLQELA